MTITVKSDSAFGKLLERAQQDEDAEAIAPSYEQLAREVRRLQRTLDDKQIMIGGSIGALAELRAERDAALGEADGVLEQMEHVLDVLQERHPDRLDRIGGRLSTEVVLLRRSLAARDGAVRAAAAAVAEMRAEKDDAIAATKHAADEFYVRASESEAALIKERDEAQEEARRWRNAGSPWRIQSPLDLSTALVGLHEQVGELAAAERERDEARATLAEVREARLLMGHEMASAIMERNEARAEIERLKAPTIGAPICTMPGCAPCETAREVAAWAADSARWAADAGLAAAFPGSDSERTLEAVRAELLRVTREEKRMRVERDLALGHYYNGSKTVIHLRSRLSEVSRDKDPQRNVTAGLLRVEQERADHWAATVSEQVDQMLRLRAEAELLKAALHDATLEDQMLDVIDCDSGPDYEAPSDWHVPAPHVPVALAANEDAEWSLKPEEIDP